MTEFMTANTINDMFRSLFALLDKVAYWLLGIMYEILFNVASADIFSNETIKNFYGRIQLIIGVFMIFKLAISIIQGIINPDTFTDKKSGFSNMITRVIFALVMLTVITPINIPSAQTEYEIQLNNNGLLFGTLYSLQNRILTNNTLGKLILGTVDTSQTTTTSDSTMSQADKQAQKLQESANAFTSAILKGFVRLNMIEGETDETKWQNRVCGGKVDNEQELLDIYTAYDANPNEILALVNVSCETDDDNKFFLWDILDGGDSYMFAYMPIISTVVAVVFIYILLGEIITIAIRTIKLAVLRLLAPIPIISYIDPKSEKDGAFGAWVKSLTSTYLELFLHLAVIYFIIFLIQDMIVNGIVINTGSGIIGIISMIFIWIGMFFFIKQAPKFIKDILGVKGTSANVGLAGLLGGTAMLAGGGGMKGFALGAMAGTDAAVRGYNEGKAAPLGSIWNQNRDTMAKIKTGDKDAQGGLWGKAMDRFNYDTREKRASMLGIGNQDVADAKFIKDQREAQAMATKRELDLATQALNSLGASARARYEQAYAKNEAYQAAFAKASSTYDKMDKDRAQMGVGPRISDKRARKYQVRQRINNTFGTDFKTVDDSGTYRSPLTAVSDLPDQYNTADLPDTPVRDSEFVRGIDHHERDLKNFSGTTDDSTIGSMGGGAGGGPGGPRP